jgi:hypothetical protein
LPQSSEARKSTSEQRNRGGLWHDCREFSDSHLAIAGPEIGDQDLIGARVKGSADEGQVLFASPCVTHTDIINVLALIC